MRSPAWFLTFAVMWLTWSVSWRQTWAADNDPFAVNRGLDVVVLVDVSRSMHHIGTGKEKTTEDFNEPNGSDPQRLRWDAVKLVVDLLTREDRLLVRRFNHTSPPRLELDGDYKQPADFVKYVTETLHYGPDREFDEAFRLLTTGADRKRFVDKIQFFGSAKGAEYFDFGGTGIIKALQSISTTVNRTSDGRKKIVILLTDGLDDRYNRLGRSGSEILGQWDGEERKLRDELTAYANPGTSVSSATIYTFGLNLDSVGSGAADGPAVVLPRRLLSTLAAMNGGDFQDIQDNGGLVEGFRRLIWSLKECWVREYTAAAGDTWSTNTFVSPEIVDVGVLAFEKDPAKTGPRNTDPPQGGIQFVWPDTVQIPAPVRSKGRDDGAYEYLHWESVPKGGGASDTKLYGSPFASLQGPTDLSLRLDQSGHPRSVWIAKRTAMRLFQVIRPKADERFNRFQRLQLEVAMTPLGNFSPKQFRVTAKLYPEGGQRIGKSADPLKTVELQEDAARARQFTGRLPLHDLVYGKDESFSYYSLGFSVEGLDVDQNPLAGFHLELPRRTIRVENQLLLRPIQGVVLTPAAPTATIKLQSAHPVDEELSLSVEFVIPRLSDESAKDLQVTEKNFQFEPGPDFKQGKVVLKAGQASFTIGLNKSALPPSGVTYLPGKLRVLPIEEYRLKASEAPVNVSIGLGRISVKPEAVELKVVPEIARSLPLQVVLETKGENPEGLGPFSISLIPGKSDSNKDPVKFEPRELWLAKKGATVDPNQRKSTLEAGLEEPFEVVVHPENVKPSGTYQFDLKVTGKRIDPVSVPVKILVTPPELELESPEITVYGTPGSTQEINLRCRLGSSQPSDADEVYVVGGGEGVPLTFRNISDESQAIQVPGDTPGSAAPLKLESAAAGVWTVLPLALKIPDAQVAPFGRYDCHLKLVGNRVPMKEATIHLVINALRVEWPYRKAGQAGPAWTPVTAQRLVQFLEDGQGMTKKFRIRTELHDTLDPQQVRVHFLNPFMDGAGDPQKLPEVIRVQPVSEGDGLDVEVKFDRVVNFNTALKPVGKLDSGKGLYSVVLQISSPDLHVPDKTTKFTVQYLKQDHLVGE